jgi:hypothetical protein
LQTVLAQAVSLILPRGVLQVQVASKYRKLQWQIVAGHFGELARTANHAKRLHPLSESFPLELERGPLFVWRKERIKDLHLNPR